MADGVIRWEDPPPKRAPGDRTGRRNRPWAVVAEQLRERPRQWALIDVGGHWSTATHIEQGRSWWSPSGAFESDAQTIDRVLHIWARYVGDENGRVTTPGP